MKVSVIIPIAHHCSHLRPCVESIQAQSCHDFEVLCAVSGTACGEDTLLYLDELARMDERFRVIKLAFETIPEIKNAALTCADGTYIAFVECDDWIEPDFIQKVLACAEEEEPDILLTCGKRYHEKQKRLYSFQDFILSKAEAINGDRAAEVRKDLFRNTGIVTYSRLYRREFLIKQNITFPLLPVYEDLVFQGVCAAAAEKIRAVTEELYIHRIGYRESREYNPDLHCEHLPDALEQLRLRLVERGAFPDLEQSFLNLSMVRLKEALKVVRSAYARDRILEKLEISGMEYLLPRIESGEEGFYQSHGAYVNAQLLKGAIEEHRRRAASAISGDSSGLILQIPYRGNPEIKVSVLIPAYNCAAYIMETIRSIQRQQLQEFEIVIINDGSSDETEAVLQKAAEEDPRISVYTEANQGASHARNQGMEKIQGEYVVFLDSDDLLQEEALQCLYEKAREWNTDVLLFDAEVFYDESCSSQELEFRPDYQRTGGYRICTGAKLFNRMCRMDEFSASACLMLQKTAYLREQNIRFPEGVIYEDNYYTYTALMRAALASHLQSSLLKRRVHPGSVMTNKVTWKHVYSYITVALAMLQEFCGFPEELRQEVKDWTMYRIRMMFWHAKKQWNQLSEIEKGRAYGSGDFYSLLHELVLVPAEQEEEKGKKEQQLRKQKEQFDQETNRLNSERELLRKELEQTAGELTQVKEKLRKEEQKSLDLSEQLKQERQKKKKLEKELTDIKNGTAYKLAKKAGKAKKLFTGV